MFFLDGGILPHQRSGRLGHLPCRIRLVGSGGLRRIITKHLADLLLHSSCAGGKLSYRPELTPVLSRCSPSLWNSARIPSPAPGSSPATILSNPGRAPKPPAVFAMPLRRPCR